VKGSKTPAAKPDTGLAISPPPILHITLTSWPAGMVLHRIHKLDYGAVQFNPGIVGNARFSPIADADDKLIPTLYGGSSFACAAMESVFHDVPFAPGFKAYDKNKLLGHGHSQCVATRDLVLADLTSRALRKLGVERKQLIDTEKDQYPLTRQWAVAIHAAFPQVQGLCWVARQDDSAQAVVLFGDRIAEGILQSAAATRSLVDDPAAYGELLALAEQIGVNIVAGRA
jgi:hypothetical protein